MSKVFQIFGTALLEGFHAGIEFEVESVKKVHPKPEYILNVTNDDSLRNSGVEVITKPLPYQQAVDSHKWLFTQGLVLADPSEACTELGSIHVHVNCQNLTVKEVQNIVYMYALYEEMFFLLCEPSRRHNIHCVPLTETYLPAYYKTGLTDMLSRWHKYTALNIKRLSDLGTIEFRHMEGHADAGKLDRWLKTLENLIVLGKSPEGQITKETLTNTNLAGWFNKLFSHTPEYDKYFPLVRDITAHQRVDLKLSLL